MLIASRRLGITLQDETLVLRATLYTQRLSLTILDLDAARIVALDRQRELLPRIKWNAFALPGLSAGHFRGWPLSRRFFCLLTRWEQVLVLPQDDGRMVLLTPERPQALLDALREAKR
jgi:hypothetical protein